MQEEKVTVPLVHLINGPNEQESPNLHSSEEETDLDATARTQPKQEGQGQFSDVIQLSVSILKQYVKHFSS